MSTKNKPYDLDKLAPDEPYFVLRAQDMLAAETVRAWLSLAERYGVNKEKLDEASRLVDAMKRWPNQKVPD